MKEKFKNIYNAIQEADALLIGASNGLSISEGYNISADTGSETYCRACSFRIPQKNPNGHFSAG